MLGKVHGTEIKVNKRLRKSAPITLEALEFIKKHSSGTTILEIGCGSGIYAKLLRDIGVSIIASDSCRITKNDLLPPNSRMAHFTNIRAINNMIEKNAVEAVKNHGQNANMSLFLSFPLPHNNNLPERYDERALSDFKGNKFFLIALYMNKLSNNKQYQGYGNEATGSVGFHEHLEEAWDVKDKLLLETGRMGEDSYTYLIYFERKTAGGKKKSLLKCKNDPKKTYKGTELSPKGKGYSAQAEKIGTKKKGLDGKMWIVSKRIDGVKFWKRK